jgi:hypothetical protein
VSGETSAAEEEPTYQESVPLPPSLIVADQPETHPIAESPEDELPKVNSVSSSGATGEPPPTAVPGDDTDDLSGFRRKLEELARRVESEYIETLEKGSRKRDRSRAEEESKETTAPVPPEVPKTAREQVSTESEEPVVRGQHRGRVSRIPFRVDSADFLYMHGVMSIPPDDQSSDQPFMLEEKGIDGQEFAFAMDVDGLRYFLSRVNQGEISVSRKGFLLLGKQESLQLRGVHESILNELRAHGIVLPFEFGSVARGIDDLFRLSSRYHDELCAGLTKLSKTSWWTLNLYVLDARLAQLFANETAGKTERSGRERERASYSPPVPQKRYDVKMLERILQKEKRLAESVHEDLSAIADRSEVQSIVGLGSGSSDDWKLILRASYEVMGIGVSKLTRTVTDLQYRHILFEPMFSLAGDREAFSFQKK